MLDLDYKEVAEKYGGNKQKIAQAAALGALGPEGPLLAVTAGMYIDRMRAAQMQEQAPQQTVAQQVLAPPAPTAPQMPQGGGLAALPPGQGAPPMAAGAPAPAPAIAPPSPGMAEGGYLPPYASGGLTDLPLPDGMFDEPGNGGFGDGYSGGGLVAFAQGGETAPYYMQGLPDTFYGYSATDPTANLGIIDRLFGTPQTKYADEAEQDFLRRRSDDYRKEQRRKDMGQLMAEAGFGMMAGNSPYAFQNIGAAVLPAISNATERARERRAEEREIQRGLLDIEAGRNTAAAQRAQRALQAQEMGVRGQEAEMGRRVTTGENQLDREQRMRELAIREAGENRRTAIAAAARGSGDGMPRMNMAEDDVVIQGRGRQGDTVIPRMRVTARGTNQYGYMFPELGDAVINPAHGAYGIGVRNAMLFARQRGLGLGVSDTGRLQFIDRNGAATIADSKMRRFNEMGANFDPSRYNANLTPIQRQR